MKDALLSFDVPGRIDGRIRRLAAESGLSYHDAVAFLLAPERLRALEDGQRRALAQWGWGNGPWKRKVTVTIRLERDHYERIRAVAEANLATISDVARYLVTGGRTAEELDADWRSPDPIEP